MTTPVSTIRNLGPAAVKNYAKAGINSAERLRELGADAAYSAILKAGIRPHFIAYYVLVMGLQGRPWNDCQGAEKIALRAQFDQLCTGVSKATHVNAELERALDRIGVIARKK